MFVTMRVGEGEEGEREEREGSLSGLHKQKKKKGSLFFCY